MQFASVFFHSCLLMHVSFVHMHSRSLARLFACSLSAVQRVFHCGVAAIFLVVTDFRELLMQLRYDAMTVFVSQTCLSEGPW